MSIEQDIKGMGKSLLKIMIICAVILYVISPFDLLPDFLFPVGFLDDLIVLLGGFGFVGFDILSFGKKAKKQRKEYQQSKKD